MENSYTKLINSIFIVGVILDARFIHPIGFERFMDLIEDSIAFQGVEELFGTFIILLTNE